MRNNITYQFELDDNRLKDFLLSFINKIIILIASFAIYFSIFYPIRMNNFKSDINTINDTKEVMLDIGLTSKLMHSDEKKKQVYSLTSSYQYYVRTLLRYDYENSPYDLDNDPDNFKQKKDEIDLFPNITDFDDDFFGYFYTVYALDKNLYELKEVTPYDYFKYEILNIDDDNDGGAFFIDNNEDKYPHLKDDVRLSLFNYVVIGSTASKDSKVDKAFFNYFAKIYEKSGNLLLTYQPYKEAYDSYNVSYQKVFNYTNLSVYVSFFASLLISVIIVPLFNKNKMNISQLILKRVELQEDMIIKPKIYIKRFVYDIFRYFPTIIIFAFVISSDTLFESFFLIANIPISLFSFGILFTFMNIVSLMFGLIRKDHRNLLMMISNSDSYLVRKIIN